MGFEMVTERIAKIACGLICAAMLAGTSPTTNGQTENTTSGFKDIGRTEKTASGNDNADNAGDNAAFEEVKRKAEAGDAEAQSDLGLMYFLGQGVEQDYKEAVEWWRKAAEQGDAKAQRNLGVMYANGRGVEQDYRQAVEWYRKAAEQGYAGAQCNLGLMYRYGQGVQQDYEEAAKWYGKAAAQGDTEAQYYLRKYAEGEWLEEGSREIDAYKLVAQLSQARGLKSKVIGFLRRGFRRVLRWILRC
jgi:TPR repeat protein